MQKGFRNNNWGRRVLRGGVIILLVLGSFSFCSKTFPEADIASLSALLMMSSDFQSPLFLGAESATADGNLSITLSWSSGQDDQTASESLVYSIYSATTSGGQDFSSPSYTAETGTTSYTATGLTAGTYYYVVRVRDEEGNEDTNTTEVNATAVALYTFTGILENIASSTLTGWTQCYTSLYNVTGTSLSSITSGCSKNRLLLTCRLVASPSTLIVAAMGNRSDVTFDVGTGTTSNNTVSGVAWYYNGASSWGFAEPGDGLNRSSCDTTAGTFPGRRLCWHTGSGTINGGYRCGTNTSLNSSTTYERVIYHAD